MCWVSKGFPLPAVFPYCQHGWRRVCMRVSTCNDFRDFGCQLPKCWLACVSSQFSATFHSPSGLSQIHPANSHQFWAQCAHMGQGFHHFQQIEVTSHQQTSKRVAADCVADALTSALMPWGWFMSCMHFSIYTPCACLAPAGLTVGGPPGRPSLFISLVYMLSIHQFAPFVCDICNKYEKNMYQRWYEVFCAFCT